MKMQPFRGTYDLLPERLNKHRIIVDAARKISELYGFEEVQTPLFEYMTVFSHTLGDSSDVVHKEMFTLTDRQGDLLALRPEGTAGVMRAVLSNNLFQGAALKYFYAGPMFRYERPQKGRYRQFHQIGVEVIGEASPESDVEVIALADQILKSLELDGKITLQLNSLGDSESRQAYRAALVAYFSAYQKDLSEESQLRLEKNPLRILDSKNPLDQALIEGAPKITQYLNADSRTFFERVQKGLACLKINFTLNERIVRGLDYYDHTIFEFVTEHLGAQGTVLGGGRYNGLSEQLGGKSLPSVGWSAGVERLELLLKAREVKRPHPISLIPIGSEAEKMAFTLLFDLRRQGFAADLAWQGSLKSRMKRANRVQSQWALIWGEDEISAQTVVAKNLEQGIQSIIPFRDIENFIKEKC